MSPGMTGSFVNGVWSGNITVLQPATTVNLLADNGGGIIGESGVFTVNEQVTPANHAPVANAQNVTTAEDTAKAIVLTGSDPDSDPLTFAIVTGPSHGSLTGTAPNITYLPSTNYNGSDSFAFKVNDGQIDSPPATVSITVTPVNDAPVANPQSVTTADDTATAITLTGSDPDGDSLTYVIVTGPSQGSLSGAPPNVTYTSTAAYHGADAFTFKVNDGQTDSPPATVSITVWQGNTIPYSNDFENTTGPAVSMTNWFSSATDLSAVTNLTYTYTTTSQWAAAHTQVLQVNTQGAWLTNRFDNVDLSGSVTYMDMMVKFTPSASTPSDCTTNDSGSKLGVFVDAVTNLAIYHGVLDASGAWVSNTVDSIASVRPPPTNWVRLTVAFDATETRPSAHLEMFQVRIDGATVSNSVNAYDGSWRTNWNAGNPPQTVANGTWWPSAMTGANRKKLTTLAFQGKGYVDDLLIATYDPFVGTLSPFWYLTVAKTGNGWTLPGTGTWPVPVGNATNVLAVANDWYRIQSLTTNTVAVSITDPRSNIVAIAAMPANQTNAVAVNFYQPLSLGGKFGTVLPSWLSKWGTEDGVLANLHTNDFPLGTKYLLNIDPTVAETVTFQVDSIAVDGGNVQVVAKLLIDNGPHPAINGNLRLYGCNVLSNNCWAAAELIASTNVTPPGAVFDAQGKASFVFAVGPATNKFYQARIE
jgi:hypothetical protein